MAEMDKVNSLFYHTVWTILHDPAIKYDIVKDLEDFKYKRMKTMSVRDEYVGTNRKSFDRE